MFPHLLFEIVFRQLLKQWGYHRRELTYQVESFILKDLKISVTHMCALENVFIESLSLFYVFKSLQKHQLRIVHILRLWKIIPLKGTQNG